MINNSFGAILLISVLSVAIILVFSLLKSNLTIFNKSINHNKNLIRNLYLSEIILGVIVISLFAGYLFKRSTVIFVVLFLLLVIVVFFIGLFFFKDYVAGLIIKTSANYNLNDLLVFDDYEGKIVKFSKRYLIILNTKGDKIFIPYSKLVSNTKYIKGAKDTINTNSFTIKCKATEDTSNLIETITNYIVSLPWVNHTVLPDVDIVSSDSKVAVVDITVYSLDSKYVKKIENSTRKMFE